MDGALLAVQYFIRAGPSVEFAPVSAASRSKASVSLVRINGPPGAILAARNDKLYARAVLKHDDNWIPGNGRGIARSASTGHFSRVVSIDGNVRAPLARHRKSIGREL